jgi:hypothetical protein
MAARWLGILVGTMLIAVPTTDAQTSSKAPSTRRWQVPRTPDRRTAGPPGFWTNTTATPLQRPRDLGDKSHFTKAEAAEYARTWLERLVQEEAERTARAPTSMRFACARRRKGRQETIIVGTRRQGAVAFGDRCVWNNCGAKAER